MNLANLSEMYNVFLINHNNSLIKSRKDERQYLKGNLKDECSHQM